ncbi:Condensation domain-containing protein [Micromonospora pallida]|uniref:Condensation domain-containing protein n=1 Tax=Micromonospora pallida TaxID=145854 RepID=A0A1C6S795_9ACTN|nr:condensation domain-containing protein [Micromonospora pallida]SCL25157.1 Condensation domain-containing protein [Micromonospora pallida]
MTTTDSPQVDDLLDELRRREVRLTVRGEQLDYDAPADALDADLLATMRRLKPALLARLRPSGDVAGTTEVVPDGDGGGRRVLVTAPASVGQARQFQIAQETDFPQVLTVALRLELRGPLDRAALRRSVTDLAVRHAVLRTRFAVRDDGLCQQVLEPRPVPLPVRTVPTDQLDRAIREWASIPFALDREPAFRAALFQPTDGPAGPDPDRHELALAIHHAFVDGWSVQPLLDDLAEFYQAAVTGRPADLPPLPAEYADFCRWEAEYLARPETQRMLREWFDGLPAGTVPFRLPTDRPAAPGVTDPGGVLRHTIPAELAEAVATYAMSRGVTPYAVYAAAFVWLMHDMTGAPVINLIASVANRTDARFDRVVGVFAQAALVIVPVAGVASFDDLARRTSGVVWQMLARQAVPSVVQVAALGPAFTHPPTRVYFDLLDLPDPVLRLPGLEPALARDVVLAGSRGELTWSLRPLPEGGMWVHVEYAATRLDADTLVDWLDRYHRLLLQLLAAPDVPLPSTDDAGTT